MTRNVTLRIDEEILRKCRHAAVEENKSLSRWVVDLLKKRVAEGEEDFETVRARALRRMEKGHHLGGKPLSREAAHAR